MGPKLIFYRGTERTTANNLVSFRSVPTNEIGSRTLSHRADVVRSTAGAEDWVVLRSCEQLRGQCIYMSFLFSVRYQVFYIL